MTLLYPDVLDVGDFLICTTLVIVFERHVRACNSIVDYEATRMLIKVCVIVCYPKVHIHSSVIGVYMYACFPTIIKFECPDIPENEIAKDFRERLAHFFCDLSKRRR